MVTRIGGLASGMDIDSLVEKLMQAERTPLNKLQQKKQTYEWTRDAYRNVNTKLKTFDTYIADNLVLKSLTSKTATSSNSSLVSATATSKATGTLSIEGVSQLAKAARTIGGQINATGSTKMNTIATGTIEFKAINSAGTMPTEATKIEITDDMTVDQFIKKVNESNAGVSAVFENGRFSFTAKNTGKGNIEINGDVAGMQLKAEQGQNAIFQVNGIATERSSNTFTINGYNITLKDTFNSTATIANKYTAAQIERDNAYISLYGSLSNDANNPATNSLLAKASQANQEYLDTVNAYETKRDAVLGASALNQVNQTSYNNINNKQFLSKLSDTDITQLANLNVDTTASKEEILANISTLPESDMSAELKEKIQSLSKEQLVELSNLDSTQLTAMRTEAKREIKQDHYNTLEKSFLNQLTTDEIEVIEKIDFSKEDPYDGVTINDELKTKLNSLSATQKSAIDNLTESDLTSFKELAAVQIPHDEKKAAKDAADAALTAGQTRLSAAEDTLTKATADANGAGILKADGSVDNDIVNSASKTQTVTMTSTTNVDDIMTKIKEFVNTYNGLVKELSDQTKESKYRDYAPLTSEQKKEMEENEIKLWEEKAKSGLLRSDSIIRNGLSNMRSLVYESNPAIEDTRYNTLFSIGITTSKNYNDGGTLEIDEEKLRKAIEENPDAVEQLFKNSTGKKDDVVNGQTVDTRGYLEKLRESMKTIETNIEKKAGRSTMTDNQYTLGKNLVDIDKRIDAWQDKLTNIEERYWKQFTAMESAINKANQQSSLFMQG